MDERGSPHVSALAEYPRLPWEVFCNLLDDLPLDSLQLSSSRMDDFTVHPPSPLLEELKKPGQYFFQSNSLRHGCEVFWLKLCLFESLCRNVAVRHEQTGRPIFKLDSRHVQIALPIDGGGYVPFRWRGEIVLPESADMSSTLVEGMPSEMGETLGHVPDETDLAYVCPLIKEWPHGREVQATVLIESMDPIPDDGDSGIRGLLRVHLIADSIVARDFSDRDVFCLNIPLGPGSPAIRLWARKVDTPERGIILSGVTEARPQKDWKALEQNSRNVASNARVIIYRAYSPLCDIYSLGMLLLRILVAADGQRWDRLIQTVPGMADGLFPAVQGIELCDTYTIHERIKEFLHEQGDLFTNSTIPNDLWWDALLLGLRAISRTPGFSYGCMTGDGIWSPGETPIRDVRRDVALIANRAKVELFESEERDAAILSACSAVLTDLGVT